MSNKKIRIDFDVRSDLYNLCIVDNSCWGISENLPAVIEILLPGTKQPYKNYFGKKDTCYDSLSLGLTCGDVCDNSELSDGIYTIKIKASPESFFKEYNYLKSDQLQRDIDRAYISFADNVCTNACKSEILEAEFLLRTAHAYNRQSNTKDASEKYRQSKSIIDRIVSCKSCN